MVSQRSTKSVPPFFSFGPAPDRGYEKARDDSFFRPTRELIEEMWPRFAPYCSDSWQHFLADARSHFVERTWEMYLACVLLEHGFHLARPPKHGPDIQIVTESGPVWVEAAAPDAGTGADRAERQYGSKTKTEYGFVGSFRPAKRQTIIRYTHTLVEKKKQYDKFLQRGVVLEQHPFVLAINGGKIDDSDMQDEFPDVLRAVYPVGETRILLRAGSRKRTQTIITARDYLEKANQARVYTDGFLTQEYAGISLVLFCSRDIFNVHDYDGGFRLVHNFRARNPLPRGFFEFGIEHAASLKIEKKDHRPRRMRRRAR